MLDICIENIFTTMIRNQPAKNKTKLFKVERSFNLQQLKIGEEEKKI